MSCYQIVFYNFPFIFYLLAWTYCRFWGSYFTFMDGFMNNKGSVVACPLNHCSLFKKIFICCRKDLCIMDVLPFFIFTMLLLIIIYPFVWYTIWFPLICRMLWLLSQWNASADKLFSSPFLSQSCWSTYPNQFNPFILWWVLYLHLQQSKCDS